MEKITDFNHSFFERTLIHIVLKSKGIREFLFDIENFYFNKNYLIEDDKSLFFITGLARSGTTAALNLFYETGKFAALTYDDFPFILSPNIFLKFKKIFKKYDSKIFKRAHDDGLFITNKSPEAFEEIFWKNELKNKYIGNKFLYKSLLDDENIDNFRKFISLIKKKDNKTNFISKNNNFILRANSILKNFPKSNVLVFFRDPVYHCHSLLNQHINFLELQKKNKFIRSYMDYLGHHEFGINLKVFDFEIKKNQNELDLEFWLEQWINYYTYFLSFKSSKNLKFICYEDLCNNKNNYLKSKINYEFVDNINLNNYLCKNDRTLKSKESINFNYANKIYNELRNT